MCVSDKKVLFTQQCVSWGWNIRNTQFSVNLFCSTAWTCAMVWPMGWHQSVKILYIAPWKSPFSHSTFSEGEMEKLPPLNNLCMFPLKWTKVHFGLISWSLIKEPSWVVICSFAQVHLTDNSVENVWSKWPTRWNVGGYKQIKNIFVTLDPYATITFHLQLNKGSPNRI